MKTIYNTYVVMESQEQCDRMKQLCLDKGLPIWENYCAFKFNTNGNAFSVSDNNDFFILPNYIELYKDKTQVTEQEFIELLKTK